MEEVELSLKRRGHSLLLPEEIENVRMYGSPVISSILLAAAKVIVAHKARSLLKEHGGSLELKKSSASTLVCEV